MLWKSSFISIKMFMTNLFQGTNLSYDRYLREVVMALEEDPEFRKKLEESNVSDIKVSKPIFSYSVTYQVHRIWILRVLHV